MSNLKHLADVNVLLALTDENHMHHAKASRWLNGFGQHEWGVCALTGAGLMRLLTNPKIGAISVEQATDVIATLFDRPGYRFWPIVDDWATLAAPFVERVYGHRQITDAYLLGLAIKESGVLVTMDKAIGNLAGPGYSQHVLLLE